jgi:SAM-dependent methyltransferase
LTSEPFRDVSGEPNGPLDAEAWNARWMEGNTPWDRGEAAPPFRAALESGLVAPPGRAVVPGCGAGHDARLLSGAGFDVTALDMSPRAVEHARSLATQSSLRIEFRVEDIFALEAPLRGYDLLLEHTCFCAIAPSRRDEYVDFAADALVPGGVLLGLLFLFERDEGPPFGATDAEIRHRFERRFDIVSSAVPDNSWESRRGMENLFLMRRKDDG